MGLMSSNITKDYLRVIKENDRLQAKMSDYKETKNQLKSLEKKYARLEEKDSRKAARIEELEKENRQKDEIIAQMRFLLNRDSSNSSVPTGRAIDTPTEEKTHESDPTLEENEVVAENENQKTETRKAANQYNGRVKTGKKPGSQAGHKGKTLDVSRVGWLMDNYRPEFRVEHVGDEQDPNYYSQYVLDLKTQVVITERRLHGEQTKKEGHKSQVIYGNNVKALCALLNTKYYLSYQKIAYFVKHMTGGAIEMSEGTVHAHCKHFSEIARREAEGIRKRLLEQPVLGTDSTVMITAGKQNYIRVFNSPEIVYYEAMKTKTLKEMRERTILPEYEGVLIHDHETALYHFGGLNSECLAHARRYNLKTIDQTGNLWAWMMNQFFGELQHLRKLKIKEGDTCFSKDEIDFFSGVYDKILALGREENKRTLFDFARKDELALLNRYEKYKLNHLVFLTDFTIEPDNNRSERNLRECKMKKKVSGGFRTFGGLEDYAAVKTVIDNLDLGVNVLNEIADRFKRDESQLC